MKRKYLILGSTLILALASITGCGRRPSDAEDPTKAQLTIFNFDGGVGENWLKEAADRFTELMQDRDDFQDGRIYRRHSFSRRIRDPWRKPPVFPDSHSQKQLKNS